MALTPVTLVAKQTGYLYDGTNGVEIQAALGGALEVDADGRLFTDIGFGPNFLEVGWYVIVSGSVFTGTADPANFIVQPS